tara:strand:- start:581 stop:1417 length:837 start_codon:yes stop_codon:yes gene_type:complete
VSKRLLFSYFSLFIFSCSPKVVLLEHPKIVSIYFENKIESLEKNEITTLTGKRKIIKAKVEYAFGVIMEESDRLIDEDYFLALHGYKKANKLFTESKLLSISILNESYPNFNDWLKNISEIQFKPDDVYDLYWLAAAIGGAIKSSRGNPFELVNLPKVGKLIKTAIKLDPDWGQGALFSAMMSFTVTRTDLSGDALVDSTRYYFDRAITISDSLDASPFITFAESIDKPLQNKEGFQMNLNYVLSMDAGKNSKFELGNLIAQKRAKWLLSKTNEYFLE